MMPNIGKVIKGLRECSGLSQRELSKLSGISNTEISRIESGERQKVSPSILKAIAPFIGAIYENLMAEAGYFDENAVSMMHKEIKSLDEKIANLASDKLNLTEKIKNSTDSTINNRISLEIDSISERLNELIILKSSLTKEINALKNAERSARQENRFRTKLMEIPVLGVIRAGEPIRAEQNIIGYEYLPEDMTVGGEYFGLKVVGDSMNNSRIYNGDVVIVREQPEVNNGETAVVLVNGEDATIKKFYKTDTTVTLLPNSSNAEHQPRIIDITKTEVRVLGKVVKVVIDL
jgi:SOS regulatory protein LexA